MADIDAVNNTETLNREEGAVPVDAQEANPLTDGLPADNNLGGDPPPPPPPNPQFNDDDEEPAVKKSRFNLEMEHVPREEDEDKWDLPEELANFFGEYTRKHYAEKDMKNFMKCYPCPSNISCVPQLDDSAKKSLKDINMGPLGAAWGTLKLWKAGELTITEAHIQGLVDQLQKSVVLVGHSMQKASWYRRVNVLSAIGKTNGAKIADIKSLLKQDKIQSIFETNTSGELFSAKFDEVTKTEKTSRSNFADLFRKKEPKKEKKETKTATNSNFKPSNSLKRPFPASPLPRGGGYRESGNSSNWFRNGGGGQPNSRSGSSNPFRGGYGKGKLSSETFCKHAPSSNMAVILGTRASDDKGYLPDYGSILSIGGKNSKIPSQLEIIDNRQEYFEHSKGLGSAFDEPSYTNPFTSGHKNEQPRGNSHGSGSREHACKRSHQRSDPETGPVSQQRVCDPKKGGGGISTHHQLERSESVCPISPFQNGRLKGCEEPIKKR